TRTAAHPPPAASSRAPAAVGPGLPARMARSLRTRLPLVVLETDRAIRPSPKIRARVHLIDHATNTVRGSPNGYDGLARISVRGQSSAGFAKKSYTLELRDEEGENRNERLLGMPSENDWTLYGTHNDKSLMRNVIAYNAARRLGRWAARTRYVELVLNGRYQGVYVLMETVKFDRGRIVAGERGIGGRYLAEMTLGWQARRKGRFFRTTVKRQAVVYDDPKREDLSKREAAYERRVVRGAERALYRGGRRAWRSRLDVASAVDYVLIEELFRNPDAFQASTFMVKGAGSKLKLGPVWDFDIAMGNSTRANATRTSGWMTAKRVWASELLGDAQFERELERRWRRLRAGGLRASLFGTASASVRELGPAARRNFRRWPVLSERVWQEPVLRGSHRAEVRALRSWLRRRVAWLDRKLGV
ncbi:MAG: CotH kinase family protein, partial [Solirubrobacteraceae bacterium]